MYKLYNQENILTIQFPKNIFITISFYFNNVKIIILKYQDLFKKFKRYIIKYLNNNFLIYLNIQ